METYQHPLAILRKHRLQPQVAARWQGLNGVDDDVQEHLGDLVRDHRHARQVRDRVGMHADAAML